MADGYPDPDVLEAYGECRLLNDDNKLVQQILN